MNSKIPINVTIDSGSLSLPASPIFQKEKSTKAERSDCFRFSCEEECSTEGS